MKSLKNWDNKTWLSSKSYITAFNKFLDVRVNLNKHTKILDIGCGRANIISYLHKRYNFKKKPIGVDIVKNKNIKRNIIFNKDDALNFLKKTNKKFDLILIKQSIHFFNKDKVKLLLHQIRSKLDDNGKLLIFSINTRNNTIPCFKKMKLKLDKSLKKDELLFKFIKNKLKNSKVSYFSFKVVVTKQKYIKMIENRYISCLLRMSIKDLKSGIDEFNLKFSNHIKFIDTLRCLSYKKD